MPGRYVEVYLHEEGHLEDGARGVQQLPGNEARQGAPLQPVLHEGPVRLLTHFLQLPKTTAQILVDDIALHVLQILACTASH